VGTHPAMRATISKRPGSAAECMGTDIEQTELTRFVNK
jgi:hypothetical protein